LDGARLAVSGVVHERADRTLRLLDLLDRRLHRLLVRYIEGEDLAALLLEVGDRLEPPRGRVDRVALAREPHGGGPPDPRRAAGDQYGFRCVGHLPLGGRLTGMQPTITLGPRNGLR